MKTATHLWGNRLIQTSVPSGIEEVVFLLFLCRVSVTVSFHLFPLATFMILTTSDVAMMWLSLPLFLWTVTHLHLALPSSSVSEIQHVVVVCNETWAFHLSFQSPCFYLPCLIWTYSSTFIDFTIVFCHVCVSDRENKRYHDLCTPLSESYYC